MKNHILIGHAWITLEPGYSVLVTPGEIKVDKNCFKLEY